MTEVIKFFGKEGKYAIFSNFAYTPLIIGGLEYKTSEHYFQSMKFFETDPEYAEEIRNAKTPLESKRLGNSKEHTIHPFWTTRNDSESIKVMRRVLFCKAFQNKKFFNLLVESGNAEIMENSPWDGFWGVGRTGNGRNMLGKLLMEVRACLVANKKYLFSDDVISTNA